MNAVKRKLLILCMMVVAYIVAGAALYTMAQTGVIAKAQPVKIISPPQEGSLAAQKENSSLEAAQRFFEQKLVRKDRHVDLYWMLNKDETFPDMNSTNSEAISYYLLWTAKDGRKETFDQVLGFAETKMLHPTGNYIKWRLEADGTTTEEGSNIASDADLRAIKALLIAEQKWNERRYTKRIGKLAEALEKVAITKDMLLAPYGGIAGENATWTGNEVWLSYGDFTVFSELAERKGEPWISLNSNMKKAVIESQIYNGLYNSQLTEKREQGNGIDGGFYSINSMWVMVRAAESNDTELRSSARKSLEFYKQSYAKERALYQAYRSDGSPLRRQEAPWVYALVGRAAIQLADLEFAYLMEKELISSQITNESSKLYGAIPEGAGKNTRVGQFTMQESILTLQDMKSSPDYTVYSMLEELKQQHLNLSKQN